MTPDHIIPADLMQSSVAELAAEVVRLRNRALAAEAETLEQARIVGMSGERELALRAKLEAAEAKVARLVDAMKGVWQYGQDTLIGPSEGVEDDRDWQREGVVWMTSRARAALREIGGGNV